MSRRILGSPMRAPVRHLVELGPMPPDDTATEAQVRAFEAAVDKLHAVSLASDEEAAALIEILPTSGEQSLFGIAWGVRPPGPSPAA